MYEDSFLLKCPDEILLAILKHLSPEDLINLSRSCHKLAQIVKDHTLWEKVKIYLKPNMNFSHLSLLFRTKHLTINGNRCYHHVRETRKYIERTLISFTNLEELTLEDYYITRETISHIAAINIKKLTLNRCAKSNKIFYFSNNHTITSNLTCLILNNILWPITLKQFLCNLSKLFPHLTELKIHSCVFRYIVSHRFFQEFMLDAFKTLEILDIRNTVLQDLAVEWLCRKSKNLKELYLEQPKYLRKRTYLDRKYVQELYTTSSCCPKWWRKNYWQMIVAVFELRSPNITSYSLLRSGEFIANNCNNLEIVAIRHYENISIENINFVFSLPKLKILDVTGSCSISKRDIERFKLRNQDVKVISSFDTI